MNEATCERCGAPLSQTPHAKRHRRIRGRSLCRKCGKIDGAKSVKPDWDALTVDVTNGPLSCQEIASRLGVSCGSIQQVERQALARMRVRLEALGVSGRDLMAYLDSLAVGHEHMFASE